APIERSLSSVPAALLASDGPLRRSHRAGDLADPRRGIGQPAHGRYRLASRARHRRDDLGDGAAADRAGRRVSADARGSQVAHRHGCRPDGGKRVGYPRALHRRAEAAGVPDLPAVVRRSGDRPVVEQDRRPVMEDSPSGWTENARLARPFVWATLFSVGIVAVSIANSNDLLTEPWRSVVTLAVLALAVPMTVSTLRYKRDGGGNSAALDAYSRRVTVAVLGFLAAMMLAMSVREGIELGSPLRWIVALVPTLPVLAMMWAIARYLAEETDEFLRHQTVTAALIGLGIVLVLATSWGFLEAFELVPHVWSMWILPAWAVGQTAGQAWVKATGR